MEDGGCLASHDPTHRTETASDQSELYVFVFRSHEEAGAFILHFLLHFLTAAERMSSTELGSTLNTFICL